MAIGGPLRIDPIRSLPTLLTYNCFCFLCILLSLSLSLSPHISVDWWSVHFPACRTYVDLTPQQDTNSFRAHDECNNHCPPTSPPPPPPPPPPTHRSNDPTLPNANERHTTMVINPTYLAQRTRSCTHSPRPSTYPTLPYHTRVEG